MTVRHIRRCSSLGGFLLLLWLLAPQARSQDALTRSSEYDLKAAFLRNFASFVEWPAGGNDPILYICVLGGDPFRGALDDMVKGETVNRRPLVVRHISRWQEPCHILWVGSSVPDPFTAIRKAPPGVLTVGETAEFLNDGGMIRLFVEDRRVRFDVNARAAENSSVRLSSRLLSVARTVYK